MKTPSLEEVKQKYLNAKEVKDRFDTSIIDIETIRFDYYHNDIILCESNSNNSLTELYRKGVYSEIISYKDKTYQLSERQKNELIKEPNIKDFFIREGIIDETIEIKKSVILNTPNDLELGQLIRKML